MGKRTVKRVLIVEDEMLVAMLVEDYLVEMGHEVLGPAVRADIALKMAMTADIDFAVLDINLAGEQSFPVADVLRERGIPFIFATGYGVSGLVERFEYVPVLQKPFEASQLEYLMMLSFGTPPDAD